MAKRKPARRQPENMEQAQSDLRRFSAALAPETLTDDGVMHARLYAGEAVPRHQYFNPAGNDKPWTVRFDLSEGAADMTRLDRGVSVTAGHTGFSDVQSVVGRTVAGTAVVTADGLDADIALAAESDVHPDLLSVARQLRSGVLRDLSVDILDWTLERREEEDTATHQAYVATRWEVGALSVVTAGASAGAHTFAPDTGSEPDTEENHMLTEKTPEQLAAEKQAALEAQKAAKKAERERIAAINALAASKPLASFAGTPALVEKAVAEEMTLDAFRAAAFEALAAAPGQEDIHTQVRPEMQVTDRGADNKLAAIRDALEFQAGLAKELPERARHLRFASLKDLAAERLSLGGHRTAGMSDADIMARIFAPAGHTSSDFPLLLANVANKRLLAAFMEDPDYRWYERIGTRQDFSDYRTHYYNKMTSAPVAPTVLEGADYESVTIGESRESATLVKKGYEFQLTKEMVANDDMGGFMRQPAELGRALARTASAVALTAFTSQTMGDGKALYHTDHANLCTSGTVPTAATLNEIEDKMRAAVDGTVGVGMGTRYLVAPPTLRTTIEQLLDPRLQIATAADICVLPVTPDNRIYPPNLSGTAYYGVAGDPSAFEFGFLRGEGGPMVTEYVEPKRDAMLYHATMSFAAVVLRYQRFVKHPGA